MDFSIFQYAYAISGGIGSGKSSVCEILSSLDYVVLDADKIAHKILDNQSQKIEEVFGSGVVERSGIEGINTQRENIEGANIKKRVDRKALAKIVFSSESELKKLQDLLNPYIYENLFFHCQNLEEFKRPYFIEIALLFEQREALNFKHKILVVGRDIAQRVMQRDGVSEEEVQARIKAQMSVEERKIYASEVIENLGSLSELRDKVLEWVRGLGN